MTKEKIIIPNKKKLEIKINKFIKDGVGKLHILSDFDKTLTKAFLRSKKITSLIAVLRNENYLTPDYAEKAHALFNKYHPIEINTKIKNQEKIKQMRTWWTAHLNLLIKSKLNKKDIAKAVKSRNVKLRTGCALFFKNTEDKKIPIIIMSSNGLGEESIKLYLQYNNALNKNITIISNSFIWDKKGQAIDFKKPIIHTMNKNELSIKNLKIYKKIKTRKNIILLGDNIDDVGMAGENNHANIIKIGFLNEEAGENLKIFKKYYDIIIPDDGSMNYINKLIKKIN